MQTITKALSNMPSKFQIIIKDNPTELAIAGADIFSATARDCVNQKGRFLVALSGGSTPRGMHRMLAEEPYCSEIPWDKTDMFWVDERCVPEDNSASNYGTAKKDFLDRVRISIEQMHPMPGEAPPVKGATLYSTELQKVFQVKQDNFPVFDLIFLGVGKDGHTASLFPGQSALEEMEKWVVAVKGGYPHVSRLTMSYPVLNHGRQIVFLVFGKEKAETLKIIFDNKEARLPAQKVQPVRGKLTWLVDRDAASLLPGEIIREAS